MRSISANFPKALSNSNLITRVQGRLAEYGYGRTSLLAMSLCCDEVNKPLIDDFSTVYGNNFNMGGLAGFAFGGVTSFGAVRAENVVSFLFILLFMPPPTYTFLYCTSGALIIIY